MFPGFRQRKTTQAACEFIRLAGGTISYMKLIKLLYLLDRESLLRYGQPVTYDRYVSMKFGPVLSETLDLINYGTAPSAESYWETHIVKSGRYEVSLAGDCVRDELSEAEVGLIREIHDSFGDIDQWALVETLHRILPEWRDPGNAALPIRYEDILAAGGDRSAEEIDSILEDLMAIGEADRLFDVAD